MSSLRRWISLLAVVLVVLVLDQMTKRWVQNNLDLYTSYQPIPALYPFFQLTHSENVGAAFGFLPQAGDVFLLIAIVVVVVMLVFYPRIPDNARMTRLGLGLVVGGALGNAFDRVTNGAVIDFIHYQIPGVISNVSNLADHAIVIGVLLIVIQSWRTDAKKEAVEETERGENPPGEDPPQP